MLHGEAAGLLVGAVALGAVHGVEPGHGWPVAASYALDQSHEWLSGLAASVVIGLGHLVSSIAMVAVFFSAKDYLDLTRVNEPIALAPGVRIGGPVSVVAGVVLVALAVREYRHGHAHGRDDDTGTAHHDHSHAHGGHDHGVADHHAHDHDHGDDDAGTDHHDHSHGHGGFGDAADRGLLGIAWFAFLLGFAHEEEFEIIALCAGSAHCLELMTAYALTVVAGIVGLTLLLVAGYQRCERRVERYAEYLPLFSAAVLAVMGVGFVLGLF